MSLGTEEAATTATMPALQEQQGKQQQHGEAGSDGCASNNQQGDLPGGSGALLGQEITTGGRSSGK